MSDLTDAIDWLYSLGKFGIKLGLENTRALMEISGNPLQNAKGIHIAGTNGKGSVAAMLTAILKKSGYRVGTYTSPHLVDFRERISVDGAPISEENLLELIGSFKEKVGILNKNGIYPTFFEVVTAMAFEHFRDAGAEVWVVETGMGGRLDSTNITDFKTGVITSIGMDHTRHLGHSLEKIAAEKAGIIKENMNVITAAEGNVLSVTENMARKKGAAVLSWNRDFHAEIFSKDVDGSEANIHAVYDDYHVEVPLAGRHQVQNASLAVTAAEMLRHDEIYIEKSAIIQGIESTKWPGRFEVVNSEPIVIMDAAHNLPGAMAISNTLMDTGIWGGYTLVLGMLEDKDAEGVASVLAGGAKKIIITEPEYGERALKMEELMRITEKYAPVEGIRSPSESVERAISMGDPVLVTGSIYLLGDVLSSVRFNK